MTSAHGPILTLNGGSSSIRFAIYQPGKPLNRVLVGDVVRIGSAGTQLSSFDAQGKPLESVAMATTNHPSAAGRTLPRSAMAKASTPAWASLHTDEGQMVARLVLQTLPLADG